LSLPTEQYDSDSFLALESTSMASISSLNCSYLCKGSDFGDFRCNDGLLGSPGTGEGNSKVFLTMFHHHHPDATTIIVLGKPYSVQICANSISST
jgi:hypothetical protein